MPRAFCPECAAEVPVDEEGHCFLGHEVPAAATPPSSRPDVQDAVEEPEPWVANVTSQGAEAPEDEAVEEPSAAAGKAAPIEEATPATDHGTPRVSEVQEPEIAEDEVELDLDTLEQAVAEMGLTAEEETDEDAFAVFDEEPAPTSQAPSEPEPERAPEPTPERAPEPEPAPEPEAEVAAERAPEPEVVAEPEPEEPAEPEDDVPDEWAAFDEPAGPETAEEPETEPDEPDEPEEEPEEEPIDTANFLARPKGKRRGLFGR